MANYDGFVGHLTDVGAYLCPSPYGTYDQAGNAWEWNEAVLGLQYNREMRGGSYVAPYADLPAPDRAYVPPSYQT